MPEKQVVPVHTPQHLDYVVSIGKASSGLVEPRRRDNEHERLPPCAEGRLDDVEHTAVLMGVELVDDAARRVQAVVRAVTEESGLSIPPFAS